jgi:hypothetical protein
MRLQILFFEFKRCPTFPSLMAVFKQMTKQSLQIIAEGQQGNATRSCVGYMEQQVKHSN